MEPSKYDPEKGLSEIDRILLRGASSGKSPEELSALTNGIVKPANAAGRVLAILESRDWLSQAQRKMLLIDDLMALKDVLYSKAVGARDGESAKPLVSVLTTIMKMLDADKLDIAQAMSQINRAHAQIMLQAISLALERSFLELEKAHPEIEKAELVSVFQSAMPAVVLEIESRVASE
jgi:hypothetical protein